jgi:hypothetical protein
VRREGGLEISGQGQGQGQVMSTRLVRLTDKLSCVAAARPWRDGGDAGAVEDQGRYDREPAPRPA